MKSIRTKQIGHLRDLFRDHHICDEQSLRRLIKGRSSIVHGESTFNIIRASDLELDDERRSYRDPFEFRETIFDCGDIRLQNSSRITMLDCVVLGSLFIGNKTERAITVELDTVVVGGDLLIVGNSDAGSSISLTSARAPMLRVENLGSEHLRILDSRFTSTRLLSLECSQLLALGNQLGKLEVSDCAFTEVTFPSGQFDMDALSNDAGLSTCGKTRPICNPFDLQTAATQTNETLDLISRLETARHTIETVDFLLQRTETRHSKRDVAQLKYLRALAESRGPASRAFVIVTGGLLKPVRIIALSSLAILAFAFGYFLLCQHFAGQGVNSFWDALYFSGITFTTIGYGDITPLDFARALAVAEGLLGVVLSSAFVVSVVRRYIE